MELPLLERATENEQMFAVTSATSAVSEAEYCADRCPPLVPGRMPGPGEQYRFHLDMNQCIGCKCCVVACNEQNGNPPDLQWRRVGEIEGGTYPDTMRLYLSMGCNHCVEPTCLTGCPVNAYTKDPLTGIVLHSADRCIGCQYCTWNCSYGVPQYNPERGVVGKCDMCYGRLAEGREPACVAACPENAIRIEIVNVAEWREEYASQANAPGLPSADDSISTTRVTIRQTPANIGRVDTARVTPEHPHWPLVFMTVFTQMSVGAIASMVIAQAAIGATVGRLPALAVVVVALGALCASTLHLGRPAFAFRALSMWRRSWLSREVLLFSLFAVTAIVYAACIWTDSASLVAGSIAVAFGIAGVFASARLYLVAARPMWNSVHTVAEFYLSAGLTGTIAASLVTHGAPRGLLQVSSLCAAMLGFQQIAKIAWLLRSRCFELRASGELFRYRFLAKVVVRIGLLFALALALEFGDAGIGLHALYLAGALAAELLGRYLFFVAVVPKNMAAPYLKQGRAA